MVRSDEEQARINEDITRAETHYEEYWGGMDDEQFIESGVSIFRTAVEVFPSRNPQADAAVKGLLETLVEGKPPQPFMGGQTAAAWRMYTAELVRRASAHSDVDFRDVPVVGDNYGF